MRAAIRCGCGSAIEIEEKSGDLDVLLGRCNEWEESHKSNEAAVRHQMWIRQSAVDDIAAAFTGFDKMEASDEMRMWVMALREQFLKLEVVA
jgi:hypothetical protein